MATSTKQASKFGEVFPRLNEQAIELLVRQSEPETALDLLKQALQELNQEKNVREGMPHYKNKLCLSRQQSSSLTRTSNTKESS